jgi:hypothetical protein
MDLGSKEPLLLLLAAQGGQGWGARNQDSSRSTDGEARYSKMAMMV